MTGKVKKRKEVDVKHGKNDLRLQEACREGATAGEVARLIQDGADPNAASEWGLTALHYAQTAEIAFLLLTAGAKIDARTNDRQTPLHHAFWEGNVGVVATLIESGADRKAMDGEDQIPEELAFGETKAFLAAEREARELWGEARPSEKIAGRRRV